MATSISATTGNVNASASSVTLFAEAYRSVGRIVYNDSTATLYLKMGATASTTSYTVQVPANAIYEFPTPCYSGVVDGIWSAATGTARVTEVA